MKKYSVKCEKKYINNLAHRRLNNVRVENSLLCFETNDVTQFSDIETIEIINNHKELLRKGIKKYGISLIGLVLFFYLIFLLTKTITKIEFVNDHTYNEEVYNFVNNKLNKVWKFSFLNDDIVTINQELRSEFYDYQWINIEKNGTTLFINISDEKELIRDEVTHQAKSLYSKYDSIVEGYYVENGTINVKVGHSVSKGDLLIDGHIKHYNAELEEVEAKGYVYGKVSENKTISIDKIETNIYRSGNTESHLIYTFFQKTVNNPIPKFNDYEVEYEDVFSIGNLVVVKRAIYYEIITTETKYSVDDAKEYAESIIYKEFKENTKYDFEKINEIKMLSFVENEYDYTFTYLITAVKDLCE